jgi:hypothetical protein
MSLAIKIKFYGEHHICVAYIYHNVANVYNKTGKYNKAL